MPNPQFFATMGKVLAGGGLTDAPSNYANLYAWWKADAIVGLTDGQQVASWVDSSASGNNATQSSSSLKPIYKTGIYNGQPCVRFDGSDDILTISSISATAWNQPWTLAVICRASTSSGTFSMLEGTGGDYFARQTYAPGVGNRFAARMIDLGFGVKTSPGLTVGPLDLTAGIFLPNYPSDYLVWYEGKTLLGNQGVYGYAPVLNRIGGPSQPWAGDICEICFWRTTLNSTQITSLYDNYFKPKWGFP